MTDRVTKRVLLVIPVHDRPAELVSLLASLGKLILDNLELTVVVVDDGSPRPLKPEETVNLPKVKLLWYRHETPWGPGYCRNLGAQATGGDYLWFLDSDTEVINPNTLVHMVAVLEADDQLAGVGGVLEECDGVLKIQQLEILPNFTFVYRSSPPGSYGGGRVDGIGTCNLLVRRQAFQRAGGFRQKLRREEDIDLCLALRGLGYRFYQDRQTMVWHKCSPSGRQSGAFSHFRDPKLYLSDLLETRLLLLAKHSPWRLPFLPILDAFLAPGILYRFKTGVYKSNRIGLAVSPNTMKSMISYIMVKSMQCYLRGFNLLFRRLIPGGEAGRQAWNP